MKIMIIGGVKEGKTTLAHYLANHLKEIGLIISEVKEEFPEQRYNKLQEELVSKLSKIIKHPIEIETKQISRTEQYKLQNKRRNVK